MQIIPHLNFNGQCREAFETYEKVLGGKIIYMGTYAEMPGADQCCGFGGLFSVKMPDISGAMLKDKIAGIEASGSEVIITGDCSCMTQINGGLSRNQKSQRAVHIADLLAQGLKKTGE